MRTKVVVVAAFLASMAIAPDAFGANMWRTNGGHDGGGSSSGGSFVSSGSDGSSSGDNDLSVPEPSALYALGSGLALFGMAGWVLRRKK
jgi:hypothetical protein